MRKRFIYYDEQEWTVYGLANSYRMSPSTLRSRIERFGCTATGIARSLATGILSATQAGRIGAQRSPWRYLRQ